ncbi:hypothetical protein JTB14_019067 [Gonioctena quinquepunctata]|nr:hypothetical protein JTB14_019067 [Gonioctena quinquepunctata]
MEPQLDYKIIGLPNDLVGELKKFYVSLKYEETTEEKLLCPATSKVMEHVTEGMMKIKNVEDFGRNIGDNYNTLECDSILGKIKDTKLRVKIKKIEHLYRAIRLEDVFRMYWESIQADTYEPSINIDEYDEELKLAHTILKKKDPKSWRKFTKMGRIYCDEHTRYKVEKSTKENLIDYFIENNDEDIAKKEEAQAPLKMQSKDAETTEEKNEYQLIAEEDQKLLKRRKRRKRKQAKMREEASKKARKRKRIHVG